MFDYIIRTYICKSICGCMYVSVYKLYFYAFLFYSLKFTDPIGALSLLARNIFGVIAVGIFLVCFMDGFYLIN